MGKGKPKSKGSKKIEYSLSLTYTCPHSRDIGIVYLNKYDFDISSDSCELCGSHGSVVINVKCEFCNLTHEINFMEW